MSDGDRVALARERGFRLVLAGMAFLLFVVSAQAALMVIGSESLPAQLLATGVGWLCLIGLRAVVSDGSAPGRGRDARTALLGYPLFLLLFVPLLAAYAWTLQELGVTFPPQDVLQLAVQPELPVTTRLLVLASICIVGPLGEEVLFRGYVQSALRGLLGPAGGLLVTSVLFGLVHGLVYAVPTGLIGLWLGWLRERTGGLLAPFVAHALHNSVTVAVVLCWPSLLELMYDR